MAKAERKKNLGITLHIQDTVDSFDWDSGRLERDICKNSY